MKFSLFSFSILGFISASVLFITNTSDVNLSIIHTQNDSITNNLQPQNSSEHSSKDLSKITPPEIENLSILDLSTFRFSSVDGAINVDKNNHLIINEDLRHWFDFYLSAIGEIEIDNIILFMEREINTLPNPGKEQAHKIMTQYLAYKYELAEYDNQELRSLDGNNDIEQLSNRLDWQMRLRRRHLEEKVVESFWKKDEVIDNYALKKIEIRSSNISESDKNIQLEELEASLPEELKFFKQELYIASNLLEKENALGKSKKSSELRNLRIQEVGIEATDRLDAIDKAQQKWRLKVLSYRNQVQKLSGIEAISNSDKEALITEYREENFNSKEILRLKAAVQLLSDSL